MGLLLVVGNQTRITSSSESLSNLLLTTPQTTKEEREERSVLKKNRACIKCKIKRKGLTGIPSVVVEGPSVRLLEGPCIVPHHCHIIVLVLLGVVKVPVQVVVFLPNREIVSSKLRTKGHEVDPEDIVHRGRNVVSLGQLQCRE